MKVLYEDNHVLAVYKPAGTLVQSDASLAPCLMDEAKNYLRETYKKPGNVFLGLVHRLDRSVAGVVVFAKTSKGASRLSEQIRERTAEKSYLALVEGELPKGTEGSLRHFISEKDGFPAIHRTAAADRKLAVLSYRVLATTKERSLLRIELETGRKHQIRLQCSAIGHPIVGDRRYGASSRFSEAGIGLVCERMKFRHPTQAMDIDVALPAELNPFRSILQG